MEAMDAPLRNSLWNTFVGTGLYPGDAFYMETLRGAEAPIFRRLWVSFFKLPEDELKDAFSSERDLVLSQYLALEWNEVYDFIEFVASNAEKGSEFVKRCNQVLERERSGYRFVDRYVTPISSDIEIASLEEAGNTPYHHVNAHIHQALLLMSNRKQPDFRNSIKESISAVEAIAKSITGLPRATLSEALASLENEKGVHSALKAAFSKLYGYTSAADGIRHALLEESSLGFDDAKFMLVACSAFVNYVIARHSKIEEVS